MTDTATLHPIMICHTTTNGTILPREHMKPNIARLTLHKIHSIFILQP